MVVLAALAGAMASPYPATAQGKTESGEFLKAVRDRDGDKATELLDRPGTVVVNTREFTSGTTALHIVTERRDLTWLSFLLNRGANPNVRDKAGVTPLEIASNLGWNDGVQKLIDEGAEVDSRNEVGATPLIAAVHRRDLPLIRILLKAGADPDRTDYSGRSARNYADQIASPALVEVIAEASQEQAARRANTYGPGA